MPVFSQPSTLTTLSVDQLLRQPRFIAGDMVALQRLPNFRFIADQIFARGSADQVAGGAMRFQRSESMLLTRDADEIAEGALWPRTGWSEQVASEVVHQFGLEVPFTNLAIRRNARDQYERATWRLMFRLVKFVDTKAMAELLNTTKNPTIQTMAASALWTTITTKIHSDIGAAQEKLDILDEGFFGDTLILNVKRRDDLLNNTALQGLLPRETRDAAIQQGEQAPFMGLQRILYTNQLDETKAILLQSRIVGTIADETPDPTEGWVSRDPGFGFAPIYVKIYDENPTKGKVVAAARWPAIALIEPRAIVIITGVA